MIKRINDYHNEELSQKNEVNKERTNKEKHALGSEQEASDHTMSDEELDFHELCRQEK